MGGSRVRGLGRQAALTLGLTAAVALSVGSVVRAAEGEASPPNAEAHEGGHESKGHEDPAGYIMHHVGDSREWELEVPLTRERGLKLTFPVWRIALAQDACPANPEDPASLRKGCLDISLSKNSFMLVMSSVLLLVVVLLGSRRDRNQLVPRGPLANFVEMLVLFVRNDIAVENIGEKDASRYTPFLLSVFFFILAANLFGLFPWMTTATGSLGVTAALAACTFVVTQAAAIRSAGLGGYLKHLTGGVHWVLWPLMIPVEIMGLFTKPFALTVRLFANMLAGHLVLFFLLGLIFFLGSALVAGLAVPFAVGIYLLELFVAFVQAYIFAMLSAVFIGQGVAMGHHAHEEHGHGDPSHDDKGAHAHDSAPAHPHPS
jgi:F-type H+-transporting ATPase subunit a